MPKLPDSHINFTNEVTQERKNWQLATSVTVDGVFTLDMPAEFDEIYRGLAEWKGKGLLAVSSRSGRWQVRSSSLRTAVDAAKKILSDLHQCEVTSSEHLVYRFISGLSYWQNPDGSIAAGGRDPEADTARGYWKRRQGKHDHSTDSIDAGALGLQAFHMIREVHKRPGIVKVLWKVWWLPTEAKHEEIASSPRAQLHMWSPIKGAPADPESEHARPRWNIRPYDDKAALFFANTLKNLCLIDNSLCAFFDDETRLQAAIESGAVPRALQ